MKSAAESRSSANSFVSAFTLETVRQLDGRTRRYYDAALHNACLASAPPYGDKDFGDLFRVKSRDPTWLAGLIVSDVDMEGYSAGRLWGYAATIEDKLTSLSMQRHAKDEAKHSRMFAKLLFHVFPDLESERLKRQLAQYAPVLRSGTAQSETEEEPPPFDELLNSMLLINLFEIKALFLGHLLKPVMIAHAPPENRERISKFMDTIIGDEARHIQYSADFIENACDKGYVDFVSKALPEFQDTLNFVTNGELAGDHIDADFSSL